MTRIYHEWNTDISIRPEWRFQYGTTHKIEAFQRFPVGWHLGEGVPLDPKVAAFASTLNIVLSYNDFSDTDVFPRPNGGIEFHVYGSSGHIELFLDSNGNFDYLENDANDEIVGQGEDIPWERALPLIREFFKTRTVSERSRLFRDTSPRKDDFPLMHSPIHQTVQAFQYLMNSVQSPIAAQSVHTFKNITQVR